MDERQDLSQSDHASLPCTLLPCVYHDTVVRVVMRQDIPWWVAKDVCRVLTIANHRDAVAALDEDEKDDVGITDAIGRVQQTKIVNESGLYYLIFQSRKPEAKPFRKWVTSEVLPQIRRTGQYLHPSVSPDQSQALLLQRVDALERRLEQALSTSQKLPIQVVRHPSGTNVRVFYLFSKLHLYGKDVLALLGQPVSHGWIGALQKLGLSREQGHVITLPFRELERLYYAPPKEIKAQAQLPPLCGQALTLVAEHGFYLATRQYKKRWDWYEAHIKPLKGELAHL